MKISNECVCIQHQKPISWRSVLIDGGSRSTSPPDEKHQTSIGKPYSQLRLKSSAPVPLGIRTTNLIQYNSTGIK